MAAQLTLRRATPDDLDALIATLSAGFESFAEFAPEGWSPPEPERERTAALLAEPTTWAMIAEQGDRAVGHVSFTPARGRPFEQHGGAWLDEPAIPGQAHLWQLFVVPDRWGSGIAGTLHDAALEEMTIRGYRRARLFTPVAHRRARRFYERRGWTAGATGAEDELGLEMVEYVAELSRRPAP